MAKPHLITAPSSASVRFLAENMRKDDVAEVKAMSGMGPLEALLLGVDLSAEAYVAWAHSEEPVAIFGVIPVPSLPDRPQASIWLLGTEGIVKHRFRFHKVSLQIVEKFNQTYGLLSNMVDLRNRAHLKWLHALGFQFGDPVLAGVEKLPFVPFYRFPKQCAIPSA